MNHLYVYVNGFDLADVEGKLLKAFNEFLRIWNVQSARVINDKYERTPDLRPEDLPTWNLGLNLEFDSLPEHKLEELICFLAKLARETGREFVIGCWNSETQIAEDWLFVDENSDQEVSQFLFAIYGEV